MAVGDISNPKVTQDYTTLLGSIRDLFISQAAMHDATGIVGLTAGAIRYSGTNTRFEKFDGTSWAALTVGVSGNSANVTGVVAGANGGTGAANTGKTITLGGNLATSGAFASTFTMTGTTTVTFPTSGALLSTAAAVTVAQGGTGATTAAAAIAALGGLPLAGGAMTGQLLIKEGTASAPGLSFVNDGAPDTGFYHISDGAFGITCNTSPIWRFDTGASTTYRLLYADTTSQGTNYTTLQLINTNGLHISLRGSGASGTKTIRILSDTLDVVNAAYSAVIMSLTDGGTLSAVVVTQTSDEDKKENWRELRDEILDALADMVLAGFFDWKDGSGSSLGGSAQELRRIGLGFAVHEDSNGGLTVNYGGLSFAIAQAMLRREKVRYIQMSALERRLAVLESA